MHPGAPALAISPRKQRAWDIANPGNQAIREELVAAVLELAEPAIRDGGALLDAGCGTGWWLRRLAAEGVAADRLHGIDLRAANVAAAGAGSAATVRVGDLRALPYDSGSFSAVFVFTVLSSLGGDAAVAKAVREAVRVLAPGGLLVVWEPRVPTPNPRTRRIRPRELEAAAGAAVATRAVTVLPPVARRLGAAAGRWYPRLARVPALRTHGLYLVRR